MRLAADAAGIVRAMAGSAVVSPLWNFTIILAIGIATPCIVTGVRPRPVWRRLLLLLPVSGVYAPFDFWSLRVAM